MSKCTCPNTEVTMRLCNETIEKVESINALLRLNNKTDAIAKSVYLFEHIVRDILKGSKLLIEDHDGNLQQIKIPGLNG